MATTVPSQAGRRVDHGWTPNTASTAAVSP